MDRWEALYNFWSSFGVPAYDDTSVPSDASFPYITYEGQVGPFEQIQTITASIWTESRSWLQADTISDQIEEYIKNMGCPKIKGGRYRVYIGDTPFAQNMGDPDNDLIKRKLLHVNFEFMTI